MIKLCEDRDLIQITLTGDLDFAAARELLHDCKLLLKKDVAMSIELHLNNIEIFQSCAIGAILLLTELVNGRMRVGLTDCAEAVHQLFDTGMMDQYFGVVKANPFFKKAACQNCYSSNCQQPDHDCSRLGHWVRKGVTTPVIQR